MWWALLLALVPTAVLATTGTGLLLGAVRALRTRSPGTVASVLRLVAGTGTLGLAVLSLAPLWSEMQYGVVILPLAALCAALVWNGILLGAAALAWRMRRSR
ncbi:hypothetical protein [Streptomyces sp. NPDC005438]|uniref:hypothetical protein n=1 Tax=Streptomyces sp. NPDC005438 TaxID=3156880 RepID=UPI0033B6603E